MGTQLPPKGAQHPIFGPCLLWPNGWMDQDAIWYGGRPWPWPHCIRWEPNSPLQKRGTAPNFWSMSVVAKRLDGSRCHLVRRKTSAQTSKVRTGSGHSGSHFSAHVLWPNGWMPLGTEVSLGPGHILLHSVNPGSPLQKGHSSPQFSAHVCCSQMVGWIKMPFGVEVGLGPGHIVLDGDPVPPPKKSGHSPQCSAHVCCGQMAG